MGGAAGDFRGSWGPSQLQSLSSYLVCFYGPGESLLHRLSGFRDENSELSGVFWGIRCLGCRVSGHGKCLHMYSEHADTKV